MTPLLLSITSAAACAVILWRAEPALNRMTRATPGPVRVAMSGRRVSPPLFESMEIVGKDVAMARLKGLREHL